MVIFIVANCPEGAVDSRGSLYKNDIANFKLTSFLGSFLPLLFVHPKHRLTLRFLLDFFGLSYQTFRRHDLRSVLKHLPIRL